MAIAGGVLAAALIFSGCLASPGLSDADKVRETIRRYDSLLAEGYRTANMTRMREVAEELQAQDEYIHMSSLGEGGVRLLPELKDLQFVKVSVEGTRAIAETRETWDYRHESLVTKKIVLVQEGLVYDLAWDLVKHPDGSWFVSDVRAISATSTVGPERIATPTPLPMQP
jgi:hypothetical protein